MNRKGAVVACVKVPSLRSPGRTQGNYDPVRVVGVPYEIRTGCLTQNVKPYRLSQISLSIDHNMWWEATQSMYLSQLKLQEWWTASQMSLYPYRKYFIWMESGNMSWLNDLKDWKIMLKNGFGICLATMWLCFNNLEYIVLTIFLTITCL
jgi:hypothetical protein